MSVSASSSQLVCASNWTAPETILQLIVILIAMFGWVVAFLLSRRQEQFQKTRDEGRFQEKRVSMCEILKYDLKSVGGSARRGLSNLSAIEAHGPDAKRKVSQRDTQALKLLHLEKPKVLDNPIQWVELLTSTETRKIMKVMALKEDFEERKNHFLRQEVIPLSDGLYLLKMLRAIDSFSEDAFLSLATLGEGDALDDYTRRV